MSSLGRSRVFSSASELLVYVVAVFASGLLFSSDTISLKAVELVQAARMIGTSGRSSVSYAEAFSAATSSLRVGVHELET